MPDDKAFSQALSVAGEVFEEEFEGECILMPTSGVLTVTGEWDFNEEEEEADEGKEEDDEEPVEMLLAFDFNDREYNVVRLIDPVMLVGRVTKGEGGEERVTLLGEDDGDAMERIEEAFLELSDMKEGEE